MSVYTRGRNIELEDAAVYCEGKDCGRTMTLLGDISGSFTIKRSGKESERAFHSFNSDGLFSVAGITATEHSARMAAKEAGWKVETVHGKEMDFCPTCAGK